MENNIDNNYLKELQRIKDTIRSNQNKAMVIVNTQMILTYYEIGSIINKNKSWGNKYIQRLSEDLKDYGKGYSYDNLKRMARFSSFFTPTEIRAQVVPQIPWSSIIQIMNKSKSKEEMMWYISKTYENRWSRSMLITQFDLHAYERSKIEPIVSNKVKESNNELVNNLFKDSYVLDFIDKDNKLSERELKDSMIDNILKLLNEFGKGFSLVGKEYRLITPTNKEFRIDLLMYHTKIHCYIVIELKIGEFKPEHLGQLQFYVNAIDDIERQKEDNETIGLLLCKEADNYIAETTLKSSSSLLGISKYKILDELPSYLIRKLNDE